MEPIPTIITNLTSEVFTPDQLERAEQHYNANFVGDFGVVLKGGVDALITGAVFYVETPTSPEYSNYFTLYKRLGTVMIMDGLPSVSEPIRAMVMPSGEVVYSRHRHDNRSATTCSASIDGGREYQRVSFWDGMDIADVRWVDLTVVKDTIMVTAI